MSQSPRSVQRKDQPPNIREAEVTYGKAAKAELARDYDLAFQLYVKAAETYLHLTRISNQSEKERDKWKTSAGRALERAEKIKTFVERPKNFGSGTTASQTKQSPSDVRLTPIAIKHFSPQEQLYVLKKGSSVNGLYFPTWDEVTQPSFSSPYQDPDNQPPLSPEQQKVSAEWRRPHGGGPTAVISQSGLLPQDILQHIVTDCSVCASISVCLEHGRRFGSKLAETVIRASAKESGRYDIRILFNGAWRRVTIDDKLPYNPSDDTLMCMSILRPGERGKLGSDRAIVWPSLLEKGYMKLMGGYDFPGSNSSVDLHAFAGWVPEHLEIKGSTFEREKTWERIVGGFSLGHCMVTLGTGINQKLWWKSVRLLPSHSYAVIDIKEEEEERTLTVLDSWAPGDEKGDERSRLLEIPWSDVLNVFDGIYLSWDAKRWQNTLSFHGMWKRNGDEEQTSHTLRINFSTTNSATDQEIWVLLTRHITDTKRTSDFTALRAEFEDDLLSSANHTDQSLMASRGSYTNGSHVLVRTRLPASWRSGALAIVASYEGSASEVGFTITAYMPTGINATWDEQVVEPPYSKKIDGVLRSNNSGGNCTYSTFMQNPQYHLRVHPRKGGEAGLSAGSQRPKVTLALRAGKDMPVNVVVVWSQGERVFELTEKELAASSGPYTYGLARLTKELQAGDYTVIVSAFEPSHLGPYSLRVNCAHPFDITPIPQECAGLYSKTIQGAWDAETAAGGPSFERYSKNPIYEMVVPTRTQIKIRLQLVDQSMAAALNVTVFPTDGGSKAQYSTSPTKNRSTTTSSSTSTAAKHVLSSGAYSESIAGVVTPLVELRAGCYWVVPSTYAPGVEIPFRLVVLSSAAGVRVEKRGHPTG